MQKKAGVTDFRFHDFRHDFGTKLLRKTGNLKLFAKALNHADLTATARYAHAEECMGGGHFNITVHSRRLHDDDEILMRLSGVNHPPLALSPLRSLVSRLAGHPYGDTESFPVEHVEQVSHVTSLDPKGTASHHVLFKPMFSDIGQRDKAHQGAMLVNAEIRLNGLRHEIIISFSAPFVLAVDS